MYVIFPADEVVYLSYGRLIVIPADSSSETSSTIPFRTNLSTLEQANKDVIANRSSGKKELIPGEPLPDISRTVYRESKDKPSTSLGPRQDTVPEERENTQKVRSRRTFVKLILNLLGRRNTKNPKSHSPLSTRLRRSVGYPERSGNSAIVAPPSEAFKQFCNISPNEKIEQNVSKNSQEFHKDPKKTEMCPSVNCDERVSSKRSSSSSKNSRTPSHIQEDQISKRSSKHSTSSSKSTKLEKNSPLSLSNNSSTCKNTEYHSQSGTSKPKFKTTTTSLGLTTETFYPLSTSREKNLVEPSPEPEKKARSSSFRTILRRSKTPEVSPNQTSSPGVKKDKKLVKEKDVPKRKLSFSDYLALSREKSLDSKLPSENHEKLKDLFAQKLDSDNCTGGGQKKNMSTSSTSTKNKWLRALKSLKTTSPEVAKKTGSADTKDFLIGDPSAHNFQEYTYKKITPCDVCSQILRGHTRQGMKCSICKMNIHVSCQKEVQKCQAKPKFLRRQKSTSEIEAGTPSPIANDKNTQRKEVDQIYQVLKEAREISNPGHRNSLEVSNVTAERGSNHTSASGSDRSLDKSVHTAMTTEPSKTIGFSLAVIDPPSYSTNSAPDSPRRQKLNLRMKSFSLDSPESTKHTQRRQQHQANSAGDFHSNSSSSSKIQSPSSPLHNQRLQSTKNIRMPSTDLVNDGKRPSCETPSSCPSPVGKNPLRILPSNQYVVLYNFKARLQDELDLKSGYRVTVIDTSDPDWWKGKCCGQTGFFPSKYVSKLSAGEKPLQVTHNLQVSDGDNGLVLLRDQIVIQIGEEIDGMVMIRSGDNRQGVCPVKFLQEV